MRAHANIKVLVDFHGLVSKSLNHPSRISDVNVFVSCTITELNALCNESLKHFPRASSVESVDGTKSIFTDTERDEYQRR